MGTADQPVSPEITRLVRDLFSELMDAMVFRTLDGRRLSVAWGEPDADGFYTPTVTETEDDWYRDHAALCQRVIELEAALTAINGWYDVTHSNELGHDHHCGLSGVMTRKPSAEYVPPPCICGWATAEPVLDGLSALLSSTQAGEGTR